MATLSIIAGPNGAGKSTYSKNLLAELGIDAFDFDKEFDQRWRVFSYDPIVKQGIRDATQEFFITQRETALFTRSNFAFETNYHAEAIIATIEAFKEHGFKTKLHYIFLENIDLSIQRVKQRVLEGGLGVDNNTIRKRFVNGLRLLNTTFQLFDTVSLRCSSEGILRNIADIQPKTKRAILFNEIPAALTPFIPDLYQFIHQK
ncbi:AAA family ATPase [Dawidia soli]|uniref:Zeta toxin family protein n=1 Tax=Dawidia soli TaxID=2782352 RepID=A0AAP2D6W8_9BACT|nr:AAA family ATPase [Dawidia soli]MBT1685540.1 zeta toxin family protein [Dawidia soli]